MSEPKKRSSVVCGSCAVRYVDVTYATELHARLDEKLAHTGIGIVSAIVFLRRQ